MRSDDDRKINASFMLFRVPVEGREKTFRASALTMADAAKWCPLAIEFFDKLKAAQGQADRYEALADVQACGIDALQAYPRIEQGDRITWDALTFEQVIEGLEALFEVNDPFTQAQNREMAKLAELGERMTELKAAGVDLGRFIPSPTPPE